MKRRIVTTEAIQAAGVRSTKDSAKLENREVLNRPGNAGGS